MPPPLAWAWAPVEDRSGDLPEAERALTGGFVPRRMRTFSSGRSAARRALALAGAPAGPIAMLADGAPAPPTGWRLSISHTDEIAVAVACRAEEARGIGVDVEAVSRMDGALRPYVVGPLDRVAADAGPERLTATFSLRESLFKALARPDPQRLYVRWDGDTAEVGVDGQAPPLRYGWRRAGDHIVSFCMVL